MPATCKKRHVPLSVLMIGLLGASHVRTGNAVQVPCIGRFVVVRLLPFVVRLLRTWSFAASRSYLQRVPWRPLSPSSSTRESPPRWHGRRRM